MAHPHGDRATATVGELVSILGTAAGVAYHRSPAVVRPRPGTTGEQVTQALALLGARDAPTYNLVGLGPLMPSVVASIRRALAVWDTQRAAPLPSPGIIVVTHGAPEELARALGRPVEVLDVEALGGAADGAVQRRPPIDRGEAEL